MMRSGIIGTGFMGRVHARAVHAADGVVAAVAGSSAASAAGARAALGALKSFPSADDLIADPEIDVVHICTPNHLHAALASQCLKHGKHVICEKPLATDLQSAIDITDAARSAGVVAAVPFVYRFYPTVRDARARVAAGDTGPLRVLHGSYLQDWLAGSQDTDWRVDPVLGGSSRAFADIGVHWCDLAEFISGHRITRLSSRLLTVHPGRGGVQRRVVTEDVAAVLFETDQAAIGSLLVSQITHGRKNRLWISLDGDDSSLAFDQELPESLWIGGREQTSIVQRGSTASAEQAQRYDRLPAGHPQGYQDAFNAFVADVYAAIGGLEPPGLPVFGDGLRAAVITSAVLASARTGTWVEVPA